VSLLPNRIILVVDDFSLHGLDYLPLGFFVFCIMLGFRHKVKDAAVVSGKSQIQQRTVEGEVHSHITKEQAYSHTFE